MCRTLPKPLNDVQTVYHTVTGMCMCYLVIYKMHTCCSTSDLSAAKSLLHSWNCIIEQTSTHQEYLFNQVN